MKDVISVNQTTKIVHIMYHNVSEATAEACIQMAVDRRGVETEIFVSVPTGSYPEDSEYRASNG